jgi:toxin ParE1/3/4
MSTIHSLAEMPEIGGLRELSNSALANLRCWPVHGFPNHIIYYMPIRNGVKILRVLHGARDAERIFKERD